MIKLTRQLPFMRNKALIYITACITISVAHPFSQSRLMADPQEHVNVYTNPAPNSAPYSHSITTPQDDMKILPKPAPSQSPETDDQPNTPIRITIPPAPSSATDEVSKPQVKHTLPVNSANPLAAAPGELRLDGISASKIDSEDSELTMRVCSYVAGRTDRVWLESPRNKPVLVDKKTHFYVFGASSSMVVMFDTIDRPVHITVIGYDRGAGKPLLARIVWIEHMNAAEYKFQSPQNQSAGKKARPEINVARFDIETDGRRFPIALVQAKLSTVRIRVGIAKGTVGATEPLSNIVSRYGALAGINGSFFDAYTSSPIKRPNNQLITNGCTVFLSDIGTVLGFTNDGTARMENSIVARNLRDRDPAYPQQWLNTDVDQTLFWQRATEVMGAGPRLIKNGMISLDPRSEGYHSAHMLNGSKPRSAVGITSDGWIYFVVTESSIYHLARIMRALGCSQAMNLDGGSSSGLYAKSHNLRRPGRRISNALLILPH